jgi:acetylornithine/succinyldiaminopimelate/putrescine aminotransferase
MSKSSSQSSTLSQREGVAAVIEPIKAIGGLVGFAIGFYTAHRSGADTTSAAIHGLIGAALMWTLAWWAGLFLVREMMLRNVEEQRRLYSEKVAEINAQISSVREQKGAQFEPPALASVPRASLEAPGS